MKNKQDQLGSILAFLLRELADDVELRSDHELRKLAAKTPARPKAKSGLQKEKAIEISEKLASFNAIKPAETYLSSLELTRTQLAEIGRLLDLPISKHHNTQQVFDRLIEATVGFRIRSATIRGDEPPSSSAEKAEESQIRAIDLHPINEPQK